jgi:16S rRNA (guanine527-N7)-methyltransferase
MSSAKTWLKGDAEAPKDNALWRLPEWFPGTPSQILEALKNYHSELLKFNLKLNLISRSTERDADEAHFADCLQACTMVSNVKLTGPVYDVGSGNGLPGIVLSILNPGLEVALIESDTRKCEFLKHTVAVLGLKSTTVMNVRFETIKTGNMGVGITRGFASLSKTLLACNKVFKKGGKFYHLKGQAWSREIAEIPSQIMSAWSPELLGEYSLPTSQVRRGVIVTTKIS